MEYDLDTPKVIGDPVHGYIKLTDLEYDLLQLPTINRLHHIGQTAAAYLVFPGSITTRFTHVVGALHVGGKIIEIILSKLKKNDFDVLFPNLKSPEFLIKSIRLACLFHDVGHGPFSHSGEEAMLKVMEKYHSEEIDEAKQLFNESDNNKIPIHEYYTYKLIKNGEISQEILSHEDEELRDFVADLVVKSGASQISKDNQKGYNIVRKIVSGQLDADRMDYLLRDSMMSGVQFGQVDIDRIIQNMAIVKNRKNVYQLAFHERALGNIEEMLDARFKMYRYFYNHHTVVATNELLRFAIDALINDSQKIAELFHWKSYSSGYSTDVHILDLLRERKDKDNFLKVKGLVDRRFLPISLFKSTPDLGRFIKEISNLSSMSMAKETMDNNIASFFKDANGTNKIQTELEKKSNLENCEIFLSTVTMKPYSPFSPKDRVYLFRANEEDLCEIYSESSYFQKINEEWAKFRGFYLFYLIPGQTKKEFKTIKGEIRNVLASEIANYVGLE